MRNSGRGVALLCFVCAVLVVAVVEGQGRRRSGRGRSEAPLEGSDYAESPYQLWPVEISSHDGMVVSGSDEASHAGALILEQGGNAVDAAVATALALGVSEPTTSGLGGETLMLVYLNDGRAVAIDGSCYVPFEVRLSELQAERNRGRSGNFSGYKSIAVPGSLAALAHAVARYGTMSLPQVLAPAIEIADFGYRMNLTELGNVENYGNKLRQQNRVAELFLKDWTGPWGPDHLYCASDLANTLRRIAQGGAAEFYRGAIAGEIEADMKKNGGYIRRADLVQVRAVERTPLRGSYRGYDLVCFPYPGGGGMLLELLAILESFPTDLLKGNSLDRLHLLIEASRIANTDNVTSHLPPELLDRQLSDRAWDAQRAKLIRFDRALLASEISGDAPDPNLAVGTTQVSVVDRWGNIAELTQTVGASFGSGMSTQGLGFMWNSNLNAFDLANPQSPYHLRPGKTAKTSMTPTILLKDGKPLLVLGSAGSDRVVPTIASVISGIADRGLRACDAVTSPRAMWGGNYGPLRPWLELAGDITPDKAAALEKRGFENMFQLKFPARWPDLMLFGGTNAVFFDPETGALVGIGDPRRLGVAVAPSPPAAPVPARHR
jgi:gamma-glutamyltranspeptidase / glutathione hydrolase